MEQPTTKPATPTTSPPAPPNFNKPWYGVPRESISWNPSVNASACIGCGTCVTTCGRQVYKFDFAQKLSVVVNPTHCMVGCTTCGNLCPTHAITFPDPGAVQAVLARPEVHQLVEDNLLARADALALRDVLPHADRMVRLAIDKIVPYGERIRVFTCRGVKLPEDCMCQFAAGDYLEIWVPGTKWLSRAYSIGNAPRTDGSLEIQLHRVPGGRFSTWAFEQAKVGDVITARGPIGHFRLRSALETPLLFVARGTGFAPIKAMIEQVLMIDPNRDIVLYWGVTDTADFYQLDLIERWIASNPNFRCTLTARTVQPCFVPPPGATFAEGTVYAALAKSTERLTDRDVYMAGPTQTVQESLRTLATLGVLRERVLVDSYGG
jgi:CDP-4-dehydro-6-deoxyglucose reductase